MLINCAVMGHVNLFINLNQKIVNSNLILSPGISHKW